MNSHVWSLGGRVLEPFDMYLISDLFEPSALDESGGVDDEHVTFFGLHVGGEDHRSVVPRLTSK